MFEKYFGRNSSKKVFEGKDLHPPQPRPFLSHHNDPKDRYWEGLPTDEREATERFLNSGTVDAEIAKDEITGEEGLKMPSQSSVEHIGMPRSAAHEVGYERRMDEYSHEEDRARAAKSWKSNRDTHYRPDGQNN